MGLLSFLSRILGLGRRFYGSPEQYLAMVQYMAFKNNPDFTATELLQWGDVMQKIMKVKLDPYKDFRDLAINGKADYSQIERVDEKLKELQQRKDLKQAIYGDRADLGEDDVLKSDSESAVFARKFVKDMAQHVRFSDEDQRQIDNF